MNWPVFIVSAVLILAFTLWAALAPGTAYTTLETAFTWLSEYLGWYFILTAAIIVIFVLIVAFSRVGKTRLGPDHSKPKFSLFTWASMLFAAGIGVDLMFFSVVGPATNLRVGPGAPKAPSRPLKRPPCGLCSTTASQVGRCTPLPVWHSGSSPIATTCRCLSARALPHHWQAC